MAGTTATDARKKVFSDTYYDTTQPSTHVGDKVGRLQNNLAVNKAALKTVPSQTWLDNKYGFNC